MALSLDVVRSQLNASLSVTTGLSAADALCRTCVGLLDVDGVAVSAIFDGAPLQTVGSSSATSRRRDEYQFTFGEGPCLDAVASRRTVLVPDLDSAQEQRWPLYREALLTDGVRAVFAVPIRVTSVWVGALDLFRDRRGPLDGDALVAAMMAAEMASAPLLDLIAQTEADNDYEDASLGIVEHQNSPVTDMDRVKVYQGSGGPLWDVEG